MQKQKIDNWLQENSERTGITDFKIKDVKAGESNHNFIIKIEEEKYVLRISKSISRESRLENEAEKLEFLDNQEVNRVPRKIFFEKDTELGEVLIESFAGDKELDKESMNDERLRSLARKIAEIHSIPVEKYNGFSGKDKPETKKLKKILSSDFEDWSKRPYEEYLELVDDPDQRIIDYFQKQQKLLNKVPEKEIKTSLVHGDLGFNIRATENQVFIVDWEFSRIDYPELEILYCFEHEKLSSDQREIFLEEYRKHRELDGIFDDIRDLYKKFLGFNDMIWAAKRVEQGDVKHRELMENRLEHLEKLYRED